MGCTANIIIKDVIYIFASISKIMHILQMGRCNREPWSLSSFKKIGTKFHPLMGGQAPVIPVSLGSFYKHGLTLIPSWISNLFHYKMWDEIIYPFPNFNGATVEVWEWISNFIPHLLSIMIPHNGVTRKPIFHQIRITNGVWDGPHTSIYQSMISVSHKYLQQTWHAPCHDGYSARHFWERSNF